MIINQKEENGVVTFTLDGRVDSEGTIELERELQAALGAGKYKLILDMANVRYINSAGLRILAEALTICHEHHGNVYLVALNHKVMRVFEIIGFDNFFRLFEDMPAAQKAFKAV